MDEKPLCLNLGPLSFLRKRIFSKKAQYPARSSVSSRSVHRCPARSSVSSRSVHRCHNHKLSIRTSPEQQW